MATGSGNTFVCNYTMRIATSIGFVVLWSFSSHDVLRAQACCSAGPPLLGSLEFSPSPPETFQSVLTYHYNHLRDLLSGSTRLSDNSRQRTVHSVLLELSYGLSSSLSVSSLISFVRQERRVTSTVDVLIESSVQTRGFGDALLVMKYRLVPLTIISQHEIVIGIGGKIPLGISSLSSGGILLPADMQPGTGAWDGILWAYASQGFLPRVPLTIVASASYRITGTNSRYGIGQQGYKFGNEFIASLGGGYRTEGSFDYSLVAQLRSVSPDQSVGSHVPNTGGLWFFIVPGLNFKLSDAFTLRASGQIPVYRSLEGIQLTTTYTVSVSLLYVTQL